MIEIKQKLYFPLKILRLDVLQDNLNLKNITHNITQFSKCDFKVWSFIFYDFTVFEVLHMH